jgi:hypothetical protein
MEREGNILQEIVFFFGTEEFAGRDIENKGIDRHGLCHGSYLLLS